MEYEILGDTLPVAICKLNKGESVFTQRGGMGWMTPNFDMKTNIKGGIIRGITRKFMKESFFMTTYACTYGDGVIAFPTNFPGSILSFDLAPGESIIAQKHSFLFAESSVTLSMFFQYKPVVALFGGEGFIMQKFTGPGKVFLEVDGGSVSHYLEEGQILRVDPGHIATIDPTINIKMKFLKGLTNWLFSGEQILLTELEGPGEVCLQTMPLQNVAKVLKPHMYNLKVKTSTVPENTNK